MRIYFLRHGIAEDLRPGMTDAERQLTPQGIEKTRLSAKEFARLQVEPSVIYSSPLVRARQTAEIVADSLKRPVEITSVLSPGFNASALLRLVTVRADEDFMIVGHEPDFSRTLSSIIGGGNIEMRKGGLARVDLLTQSPLSGVLIWLAPTRLWED